MPYGPYYYQNGQKLTYGSDGRWWLVTSSYGGNDYGYPVGSRVPGDRSLHHHTPHFHSISAASYRTSGPSRRVGSFSTEDPDDTRIRQLAIAVNQQAGAIGTTRGIGEFYVLSLAGAAIVISAPEALLEWNDVLLGSARGRLFWSGYRAGALDVAKDYAVRMSARVISGSGIGVLADRYAQSNNYVWASLSRWWAFGSEGPVDAFIADQPGTVWQEIELPILWSRDGFTRLLHSATPIIYHHW